MDISKVKVKNKKEKALELMKSVGLKEEHAKRKILKLSGASLRKKGTLKINAKTNNNYALAA